MKANQTTIARLICAGVVTLSVTLGARADYQSTVLSQGPVGYWRLNETTQPPVNSTTANLGSLGASVNGVYNNSPSYQQPGPFAGSYAVGLDGVSQSVTNPWVAGLNTTPFSAELWVNPAQSPFFGYIAASAHLATSRSGWYLAQDDGSTFGFGPAFVVRMFYQNGVNPAVTLLAPLPTNSAAGTWYHIVITFDGTHAILYTNGVPTTNAVPLGYVPNVDTGFSLGMRLVNPQLPWPGKAAEVAMYNTALSAARVSAHYTTANTTPANYASTVQADSPLLYWRFREAPSVGALNIGSAGSAENGVYQFGVTTGDSGPRPANYPGFESTNYAPTFPGTGPAVSVPALNINTNTMTISCWVKATTSEPTGAGLVVCHGGNTYSGLTIDAVHGGLGLGYVWNNDQNTYNYSPSSDSGLPQLPLNDWAFVALVIRPTEANVFICDTNNPANFSVVTNSYANVNQLFEVATLFGSDNNQPTFSFTGDIDEVAIWNRSLNPGELYSQYAAAVGGVGARIFADPQVPSAGVYAGDTLILSVDAGGTPLLSYQWYKTSGKISGATNTTYTKANVQLTDSDNYYCIVTNLYGQATSGSAAVTVNSSFTPVITTPPMPHNLYPGGSINLSVVATGGGLTYQWKKGSTNIPGATSAIYHVASVTNSDAGSYSVVVSNSAGTTTGGPVAINVFAPANAYETAIVADAPEAWFRLNETSGTNMFDSMGRHDGFYTNESGSPVTFGATGAVAGSSDTAVTFPGPNGVSYGIAPYSPLLNKNTFTIECWGRTSDTVDQMGVVSSHSGVPAGYGIWTVPAGNWSGEVSQGGNNYYVASGVAGAKIVAGQYTHVVMVYDTSLKVYINGQYDGTNYVNFDHNISAPFIIGGFGPSPVSGIFNGQVDEVLVYTNGLTLAQVQNHYNRAISSTPVPPSWLVLPTPNTVVSNAAATTTLTGVAGGPAPINYQWFKNGVAVSGATNTSLTLSCIYSNAGSYVLQASNVFALTTNSPAAALAVLPPKPSSSVNVTDGLVLHLKFDGNYQDSSGRGNNGTATGKNGALPSIVAGRIGSGAVHYQTDTSTGVPFVDNTNAVVTDSSYVTLGNPADLQFGSTTDFSVSYWVQLPAGYLNGDLPFLSSAAGSTFNTGFTFAPGYTNGGFGFSYNALGLEGTPNSINDGNWHHLLHTVSRTGNAITYLDGVAVVSQLATGIGNMNTAGPVNIGQDPTGLYPEQGSAAVDDLAVWRRSLTSYEAYAVYYAATNSNASFDVPGQVKLSITIAGTNVVVTWNTGATLGTLMQADSLSGPWTPVGVYVPFYQVPHSSARKFYRVNLNE
jgi:hypothetical protein